MGGIVLLIRRMTASFGKLRGQTLELKDGLNIIQAPNESGKSTWSAFLLAMFYGINSRERDKAGFIAEKNRYAPWSGATMSGRLDCRAGEDELTLTRTTRRQTAPMGEFRAVYTGTGDAVSNLTGPNCGETLLGVSREVFERSAFIRQAGLPISQDAGLERRIAALISSGEEETSYSETADLLKKQLNRRRHNKTGQIPALEEELQTIRQQLSELRQLEVQLTEARASIKQLEDADTHLNAELAQLQGWEAAEKYRVLEEAKAAAQQAEQTAAILREQLIADRIPETETIGRLRGALAHLESTKKALADAQAEQNEAAQALLRAQADLQASPFAGQTPDEVRRKLSEPPQSSAKSATPLFIAPAGVIAAAALALLLLPVHPIAAAAAAVIVLAATALGIRASTRASAKKAAAAALLKRYGTDDPARIAALAHTYYIMYDVQTAAQATLASKTAAAETLRTACSSNEQAILQELRRFAPAAFDLSTTEGLLQECDRRRSAATTAEAAARERRLRYDLMSQQLPPLPQTDLTAAPPRRERADLLAEQTRIHAELMAARSAADRLSGRIHAVGDPAVLQSTATHLEGELQRLESEYTSIRMAMDALEQANTTLQNRFSPALGHRAAEIFHALTGGRYNGVTLDRSFHLSAEPADDIVYRDAQLLSAGASDQLYLAVRLAICELVLPDSPAVPIILDDALANFDDERCAAALRWLKEAAKTRQILLFTCHEREAAFFAQDEEVSVLRLTNQPTQV